MSPAGWPSMTDTTTPTTAYDDPWQRGATTGTITVTYASDDWTTSPTVPVRRQPRYGSTHTSTIVLPKAMFVAVVPDPMPFVDARKEASRAALVALVQRSRKKQRSPKEAGARNGYQQMCRIPCYRGVRTR